MLFWQVTGFVRRKKILVLVCEDFGLIGINCDSIQEIKFNYGKLGRHVAKKKKIQGPCSKLKRIQISKIQKSELKTANKTSNGIGRFIHDTPCECVKQYVTIKKCKVSAKTHFLDFWCKVVLINFNLMAKEKIKKNLVNEETKGPETLQ